ncbi:Cyclolysin [Roseibium album]|nr:Cyclolysin [Roseibium album]
MSTGTIESVSSTSFDDVKFLPTLTLEDGTEVKFQGHHIVPKTAIKDNEFIETLSQKGLWNNNNFALNGIALPSNNADLLGLTQHSGGHTAYNGALNSILSSFDRAFRDGDFGGKSEAEFLEDGAASLNGLVSHLKSEFTNPASDIVLHSTDEVKAAQYWNEFVEQNWNAEKLDFKEGSKVAESTFFQAGKELKADHPKLDLTPWGDFTINGKDINTYASKEAVNNAIKSGSPIEVDFSAGDSLVSKVEGLTAELDSVASRAFRQALGYGEEFLSFMAKVSKIIPGLSAFMWLDESDATEARAKALVAQGDLEEATKLRTEFNIKSVIEELTPLGIVTGVTEIVTGFNPAQGLASFASLMINDAAARQTVLSLIENDVEAWNALTVATFGRDYELPEVPVNFVGSDVFRGLDSYRYTLPDGSTMVQQVKRSTGEVTKTTYYDPDGKITQEDVPHNGGFKTVYYEDGAVTKVNKAPKDAGFLGTLGNTIDKALDNYGESGDRAGDVISGALNGIEDAIDSVFGGFSWNGSYGVVGNLDNFVSSFDDAIATTGSLIGDAFSWASDTFGSYVSEAIDGGYSAGDLTDSPTGGGSGGGGDSGGGGSAGGGNGGNGGEGDNTGDGSGGSGGGSSGGGDTGGGDTGGGSGSGGGGGGGGGGSGKPLVVDLDNDGLELTLLENSSALFDFDNDGYDEATAWVSPDDALLFWDAEGDGQVHGASQIAFAQLTADNPADTDLEALATVFDSNQDGVFDASDERWSEFRLWQDADSDGVVDDGELTTLTERGITSIGLSYSDATTTALSDGTVIHGTADATTSDGNTLSVGDVSFAHETWGSNTTVDGDGVFIEADNGRDAFIATNDSGVSRSFARSAIVTGAAGNDVFDAASSFGSMFMDGKGGNDSLTGGFANDVILGGIGNDTIEAGSGQDVIFGDQGNDQIDGGLGSDTVIYSQSGSGVSVNLATGTGSGGDAAGDTLTNVENIVGSEHADILVGDENDNALEGLGGNDDLSGASGDDILSGGAGADQLDGGAGDDVADYTTSGSAVEIDLTDGTASGGDATGDVLTSIESLFGSGHDDRLRGDGNANRLYGLDGDDQLRGESGNDVLSGGAGNDALLGGAGDDTYVVGFGHEAIGIYDFDISTSVNEEQYLAGYSGQTAVYGTRTTTTHTAVDGGNDTIQFESLVSPDDLSARQDGDDLILTLNAENESGSVAVNTVINIQDGLQSDFAIETLAFTSALPIDISGAIIGDGSASISGTAGSDTVLGTDTSEIISTGDGDDAVIAGLGNDTVTAGSGNDRVWAGFGNDTAHGGSGEDLLSGGTGNDQLFGEADDDILQGGDGDDLLDGGTGDDLLIGGTGDDDLVGGAGADILVGGSGTDRADYSSSSASVSVDLFAGAGVGGEAEGDTLTGIEYLTGSAYADSLTGNAASNRLDGQAGDDRLAGLTGADELIGGAGTDTADYSASDAGVSVSLAAGTGFGGHAEGDTLSAIENLDGSDFDDDLTGDAAANRLDGKSGNDRLAGLAGADALIGGDGTDVGDHTASDAGVVVNLATGTGSGGHAEGDTLSEIENLDGSAFNDVLTGDAGSNRLDGKAGDDRLAGLGGADELIGGEGIDTADYTASTAAVTVNLTSGEGIGGHAEGDTLSGIENIDGSAFNDLLIGDAGSNRLDGKAGDDRLIGLTGTDELVGGDGIDTADYTDSDASVIVNLTTGTGSGGHADGDTLSGVENLDGSVFDDDLTGDAGSNRLDGKAGDDRLAGLAGADVLIGGDGVDTADYTASDVGVVVNLTSGTGSGGHAEGDTLTEIENLDGSAFDDVLTGDAGSNRLDGKAGDDRLAGLEGADELIGDAGVDTGDYTASDAGVTVNLTTGTGFGGHAEGDTLSGVENLDGSAFDDLLIGDASSNRLDGKAGDDRLIGLAGADELIGGAGIDTADYTDSDAGVIVNLTTGTGSGGHAEGDTLSEIENLDGSAFDDELTGDEVTNVIQGFAGSDQLSGLGGDDLLDGGTGNDSLSGGIGDDWLIGGPGADALDGGEGIDTADYSASDTGVTVDLVTGIGLGGHAEGDTLQFIENLVGSSHDDILLGDALANKIEGLAGNDHIDGREGNDLLLGGAGYDDIIGGRGNDVIEGGDGNDVIDGDLTLPSEYIVNGGFASEDHWSLNKGAKLHTSGAGIGGTNTDRAALNLKSGSSATQTVSEANAGDVVRLTFDASAFNGGNKSQPSSIDVLVNGLVVATFLPDTASADYSVEFEVPASGIFDLSFEADGKGNGQGVLIDNVSLAPVDLADGADDVIDAGSGNDVVYGNFGADDIEGGAGNDYLDGGSRDDTVFGSTGDDILIGASGNDQLTGGDGNDVLIGDSLAKNLLINGDFDAIGPLYTDDIAGAWDIVPEGNGKSGVFGPGEPGAGHTLKLGSNAAQSASQTIDDLPIGLDLQISLEVASLNGKLLEDGPEAVVWWNGEEIDRISSFNDWETLTYDVSSADGDQSGTIAITYANDGSGKGNTAILIDNVSVDLKTTAGSGDDVLIGGDGDDWMLGGAGADTFVFQSGDQGHDTVKDFSSGEGDVLQIESSVFADFAEVLAAATDDGANTVLTIDGNTNITLENVQVADLTQDDFQFV